MVSETLVRFGHIDILVNNAASRPGRDRVPVVELEEHAWDLVQRVNVKGPLFCSQAAAREMIRQGQGGSIVNFASLAAKIPRMNQLVYCMSKAALVQMTKVFALELAHHGIRVNGVAPGPTDTPMVRLGRSQEDVDRLARGDLELFRLGVPLGRLLTPQEQANAVLFLVSDQASAITGHVLFVDGGEGMF